MHGNKLYHSDKLYARETLSKCSFIWMINGGKVAGMKNKDLRREILRRFRDSLPKGDTELADLLDKSLSQINQVIGPNPTRGIGDRLASDIEKRLGKREGWLDSVDTLRELSSDQRALVQEQDNVSIGPDIGGSVPMINWVQAGDYVEVIDHLQPGQGERIPVTVQVRRYTFALRVEGDSMEPEFMEGVVIVVEPEMHPGNGDYVVVRTAEGGTTFKQLVEDGGQWYLKPKNDRYPIRPLPEDAVICGVVREQVKRYR
jgi:SOS-response transcriptional repressor LexA